MLGNEEHLMATREIIEIDEDKCDGCGACAGGCHEGALRINDGKARLVGESLCDGLGACIGECPRGAIKVTRREADAYDEVKVMEGLSKLGPKVIAVHLKHWPIQLHLINPRAPQFVDEDLIIAADCTAFALGSFHAELLAGKSLVIACPKLDHGREIYIEKLAVLLRAARSVTVAIMEVPCCSGLLKMVLDAREGGEKRPAVEAITVGIAGGIVAQRRV
jgi:ferredoxin